MNTANDLRGLVVTHHLKDADAPVSARSPMPGGGLLLDTCLRRMRVDLSAEQVGGDMSETLIGADAYRFVLEITTGLRSAIAGETNVFGQFKEAWQAFRMREAPAGVARLAPVVHAIINDTRAIRRDHLQGIGGASYGTLVRRLIGPAGGERVLFVGAGNLARSMLPLFRNFELGLWNRREPDIDSRLVGHVFAPADGRLAASWAQHVVMTTPPDASNDLRWRNWLLGSDTRTLVHLGQRRGNALSGCSGLPGISGLPGRPGLSGHESLREFNFDDVIELQNAQAALRARQLDAARRACQQHASAYIRDERDLRFARLKTA